MKNKKPIANFVLCNNLALNVYDIEYGIEDYVIVGYSNENIRHKRLLQTELDDNYNVSYYFRLHYNKYYLDEFIRL